MTRQTRIRLILAGSVFAAMIAAACADPVHDTLVSSLGPEDPTIPQGEYHRAGQPCTACHGSEGPAKTEFALAGTIFWSGGVGAYTNSAIGVPDASVSFEDSLGSEYIAQTNCVGNFFVRAEDYTPAFPILVSVFDGTYTAKMATQISRATSCADCHFDPVNYDTPGHIFLTGGAPPAAAVTANEQTCPVEPDLSQSGSQQGLPP